MLDSQLNESIDEALLSGKPLSLSLSSWSDQYFTLANRSERWQLVRAAVPELQSASGSVC